MLLRNFANPDDDIHHNYNLYKKTDGKWLIIGWDFEGEYGGVPGVDPTSTKRSLYNGEYDDKQNFPPDTTNPSGLSWNRFKDAYLKSFKTEYNARLRELVGAGRKCPIAPEPLGQVPGECLLKPNAARTDPPNITNIIDDMIADFDQADWDETRIKPAAPDRFPSSYQCRPKDFFGPNGMKK